MNGEVIGYLDCVPESEEPELLWEEVFCHVVLGDVADVFPVCFGETILVLSFCWGTGDLCGWVEIVGYDAAY